jgi:hypothetical protein
VATLMRQMGITAIAPKRRTSKPAPGHKIYPYLLRGLEIERAGQVWYLPELRRVRGRLAQHGPRSVDRGDWRDR